jgi:putative ABC transport system substrate-binding protein
MRRREFITLLGGAAAAWPLVARAQQAVLPMVGFLRSTSLLDASHLVDAFRQGLKDAGYDHGQNVAIEYRSAEDDHDKLRALVGEFVRRSAVIVGNTPSALAAKAATMTIPIVFVTGSDPVSDGLVTSVNRPGGNLTGASFLAGELGAKRLELLRQVAPKDSAVAVLVNPHTPVAIAERTEVQVAAKAIGQRLIVLDVESERELEAAFTTFADRGVGALLICTGAFMNSHRQQLAILCAAHRLPAIFSLREFVGVGGLMSYGASITDAYRQAGIYTGRILKGERPADLPVVQPTKFELLINLKTARALRVEIPPSLLALTDEVIE